MRHPVLCRLVLFSGGSKYANVVNTLLLTLPGTPTCYQGDELGMLDVPVTYEQCQDPYGKRFGPEKYSEYTRDPCRSPMIWESDKKNGGFADDNEEISPWLPLSKNKTAFAVDQQKKDPDSYLNFFRRLLQLRDTNPVFYQFGHNLKLLAENEEHFFVYERKAAEKINESDYVIILNISQDTEGEFWNLDLSKEIDYDHSATIVLKACADDERQYQEGQEIDLGIIKMKAAEVLIVRLEEKVEGVKRRKVE